MTEPGGLPEPLQTWLARALDFIFPPRCVHCERAGSLFCANCQAQIKTPPPLADVAPLSGGRANAVYDGPIRDAIHAFKYKHNKRLADLLAARLAHTLNGLDWQPSLISAVPLHADRLRERGYNQSALLGERLATQTRLPFRADAVIRARATRPQVGLDFVARQANVADAFHANPDLVRGQAIVLVDDVYTTGATLRACAAAIRAAGAAEVWALTVACTTSHLD